MKIFLAWASLLIPIAVYGVYEIAMEVETPIRWWLLSAWGFGQAVWTRFLFQK